MRELASLQELGAVLMEDTNHVLLKVHEALAESAALVRDEAKAEFGTYQGGIGPFQAWPELADSTKADRLAKGFTENDPLLRTGELRDSISALILGFDAEVGSDSPIMPFHEFGTSRMPPRPVLGIALQRCWPQIQKLMGLAVSSGISGGYAQTSLSEGASSLVTPLPVPPPGYDLS